LQQQHISNPHQNGYQFYPPPIVQQQQQSNNQSHHEDHTHEPQIVSVESEDDLNRKSLLKNVVLRRIMRFNCYSFILNFINFKLKM
jgi:hypothetical protein